MTINEKIENRKKNSDQSNAANATDLDIFLLSNGPARTLWSITSLFQQQMVELVPVFDTEEHVMSFLKQLQEKQLQIAKLSLPKLQSLSETNNYRFLLNPKVVLHDEHPFFKEGPNWNLTIEQLAGLLLSPNKKRSAK